VSANGREAVAGLVLASDGKGDDGGAVAGKVVFTVALEGVVPVVLLLDLLEAGLAQTQHGLLGGMKGRLSLVHKVEKVFGLDRSRVDLGLNSSIGEKERERERERNK